MCLVSVPASIIALMFNWSALDVHEPRQVTVTIFDESHMPVPNAKLEFTEFEMVVLFPVLTFVSPARNIQENRAVMTNADGKAHFTVTLKQARGNAVSREGQKLYVVYSQTSDNFGRQGPPIRGIFPGWDSVAGLNLRSHESTIVVSSAQPK